jgi:homoserine kinase
MKPRAVRAFAPATIANLGSGFDVLGLALEKPGDSAVARRMREPGLKFSVVTPHEAVPREASSNVAAHVASLLIEETKPPFGVELLLEQLMPVSSGLGRSAASSVAAVMAVNAVLPRPLRKPDLLRFAIEGERMAAGFPHADNVAPSLLGGVCLVLNDDPLEIVPLPIQNRMVWVVVHPHCEVRTKEARDLIPAQIPIATAVRQWACVSALTAALSTGDARLAGRAIEDRVAEPVRSRLIPGFEAVKTAAFTAGATGCTLSGSGPSLFAITSSLPVAREVGVAMSRAFAKAAGLRSDVIISRINLEGARILWRKDT